MSAPYPLALLLLSSFAGAFQPSLGDGPHCIAFVPSDTGVAWSYDVSYSARGEFDIARLLSPQPPSGAPSKPPTRQSVSSTLHGVIRVSLTSREADTMVAALTGDVAAAVGGNADSDAVAEVRSLFARGFAIIYDSAGALVGIRAQPEETSGALAFARALLGIMQIDVPCTAWSGQTNRWTRSEADPNGIYEARYSIGEKRQGIMTVVKSKGTYLPDSSGSSSGATPIFVSSSGRLSARLNSAARRITSLAGTDSQVVSALNAPFGSSVTTVRLTFVESRRGVGVRAATIVGQTGVIVPLYVRGVDSLASRRMATRALGGGDLEDVVTALRELNSTGGSAAETTPAFRLARAFIVLRPAEVDSLGSLLRTEPGGSPAFRTLTAALASAGSPAAEHALATALGTRIADLPAARRIVAALGSMSILTSDGILALENAIERASDERVSSEAALALGNAVRSMSAGGDSLGGSVVEWLDAQLAAHASDERRLALVNALGNSRSRAASPSLLRALDDPNPDVRAAAVQALSAFRDSVISLRLARILRTDTTTLVRLRAAAALDSIGDAKLISAERDALMSEPDADVRMQLVTNLWAVRDRWPEIESLIRGLGTTDPADRVKELIARLLSTRDHAPSN